MNDDLTEKEILILDSTCKQYFTVFVFASLTALHVMISRSIQGAAHAFTLLKDNYMMAP